jgi:hypothetical protein
VPTALASGELSSLIEVELLAVDAGRRGVKIGTRELSAAKEDVVAGLQPSSSSMVLSDTQCLGAFGRGPFSFGQELFDALPASYRDEQVTFQADAERLLAKLAGIDISDAAMTRYYATHKSEFTEDCLNGVQAGSQAAAQALVTEVAKGTPFGQLPNASSLGCLPESEIAQSPTVAQQLAGLSPGQLTKAFEDPQSQSWVVFQLTKRQVLPYAEVAPQIRHDLLSPGSVALNDEIASLLAHARVWVDPRYGKWVSSSGATPTVQPAAAPPSSFLIAPAADQPPGTSAQGSSAGLP